MRAMLAARNIMVVTALMIVLSTASCADAGRGSMYGRAAPAFEVKGPYGEVYSLEGLRGNFIVLQFGTSW